jgi:D-alanyl-lipoteichoic acid acyltransferase DltB (MBOAT superfamily)
VATYAFTLQIYFDFSAYSEIARGSARLFGIDLMRNFDQPYLVTNVSDFWRRWHISLSTWIRDYVYRPLGGNRGSKPRVLFNLVVTMFLSGLWHGAAWNFVRWGLYHGLLLLVDVLVRRTAFASRLLAGKYAALIGALSWLVTFHLVVLGWVLFRVDRVGDVGVIVSRIGAAFVTVGPTAAQLGFFAAVAGFLLLSRIDRKRGILRRIDADPSMSVVFYAALIVAAILGAPEEAPAFIYFQF